MIWLKNNNDYYTKSIGNTGVLFCIRHRSFGDIWWEINYSDEYIDKYIETDNEEIDHENIEKVLEYADNWLSELIENIKTKYNNLKLNRI